MTVARRYTVIDPEFAAAPGRLWSRTEIESNRLPGIPRLGLQAKTGGRVITAVGHAVFATRIASDSIHHPVFIPIYILEQLGVAVEMAGAVGTDGVGHEIAGRFPASHV